MKQWFWTIALSLFTFSAFAAEPSVAAQAASTTTEWGQLAKDIAEAIGIAAKGVNLAVNDFIASPAGVLTVLFIVIKMMGMSILKFSFLTVVGYSVYKLIQGIWTSGFTQVETRGWFGSTKIKNQRIYYAWSDAKSEQVAAIAVTAIVALLVFVLTLNHW